MQIGRMPPWMNDVRFMFLNHNKKGAVGEQISLDKSLIFKDLYVDKFWIACL